MTALRPAVPSLIAVLALLSSSCASPVPFEVPFAATPTPARHLTVLAIGPEGGVASANVCAASRDEERCVVTGADGRAQLTLRPATYTIRVTPQAGSRLEVTRKSIDLTSGDATEPMAVLGRALIGGAIRNDGGALVTGAEVCAHATLDDDVTCVHSDAGGRYSVGVRPGTYKLEVSSPVGARLVTQWARGRVDSFEADVIDVRVRDEDGVDVTLIRGVVLDGTVRAASDGRMLEEAQVCTQTLAEPLPWDCERTDKNGRYRLLREPGRYWFWTIPSDKDGERLRYQKYDRVDTGVDSTAFELFADSRLDVALQEGPRIVGRVTVDDGSPVPGALVCVDTPFASGRICRETKGDGTYAVATRPETYVLQILPPVRSRAVATWWRDGRDWTDATAVVVRSGDARVDVVLRKGVRVSGLVLTPDGTPVEAAPVNVSDARGFLTGAYTDHRGRYEVIVPRGTYTIEFFAPRASELQSLPGRTVTVDADTTIDAALPPAAP